MLNLIFNITAKRIQKVSGWEDGRFADETSHPLNFPTSWFLCVFAVSGVVNQIFK